MSGAAACIGVILAGGQSTRMGRDKAMLDWQGKPLLTHMRGLLLRAGVQRVVVSGAYPAFAGIPDLQHQRGPLGGLHGVAGHLPDGDLLVVAVDMPLLRPALLTTLLRDRAQRCSVFAGQRLPMRLRLDDATRRCLDELLAGPAARCSLQILQAALGVRTLAAAEATTAFANCNTPADWALLQQRAGTGATDAALPLAARSGAA
ncbi:MAG TPA: molybdenum cofactor guanylyltransferase [Stenotrophomonas sp.]|nr:molybdenum cofactor guanylyltransferase [Stenotrophomonas sp.]